MWPADAVKKSFIVYEEIKINYLPIKIFYYYINNKINKCYYTHQ